MRYQRAVAFPAVVPRDEGSRWALIYQQCRSIRSRNVLARVTSSVSVSGQGGDCEISLCLLQNGHWHSKEMAGHKQIEYSKYNSRGEEVMLLIGSLQTCSVVGSMIKCFISTSPTTSSTNFSESYVPPSAYVTWHPGIMSHPPGSRRAHRRLRWRTAYVCLMEG